MPITIKVTPHQANSVQLKEWDKVEKAEEILRGTWGKVSSGIKVKELVQCSLAPGQQVPVDLGSHHHLVLRPDDIWMAILCQFNFFVNANSEELRSSFVAHEGKKTLEVVDKDLKDWILPNFSTTTNNDTVIFAVIMMSTMKAYFKYLFLIECGLPSVTLLGTKSDWESLYSRLDKLYTFGAEPAAFTTMLKPILSRFVQAFTNAETDAVQDTDFWSRICHYQALSGSPMISGWITAFCAWNVDGKWKGPKILASTSNNGHHSVTLDTQTSKWILDNVSYTHLSLKDVPPGYCEVDVRVNDNGVVFDSVMVSGLMGSVIDGKERDILKPLPAWFIFEKEGEKIAKQ
ncbi:hypothetical protein CPB83DRAFT_875519 [Crepidotus variabilis]|uniref:Uncharacterized protein n=1 Tax=Crepidotus variabilis TaxID=179855 RepID=A0A9P6EHU3_9AGAR|nr:hypothetical protein CPB83DRAFT_875519 [Crepidotus variabilis]